VLDGEVEVAGDRFAPGRRARVLLLGGAAMDGPRYLFLNFASSSRERIEQAKVDWRAGRFGKVPGDEMEFIPLPERVVARAGSRPSEPGRSARVRPRASQWSDRFYWRRRTA
jgi:hypothetical protein